MPELPEIEVIKLSLQPIINKFIGNITIYNGNLRYKIDESLKSILQSKIICNIKRRSKYLILELSDDYCLVLHLGMTGRFTIETFAYELKKHDHFILELSDKSKLVYNDIRRFGYIFGCYKDQLHNNKFIRNLGPEPLTKDFSVSYLYDKLQKRSSNIKSVIMDSSIVVGVGNIYANEALFSAGISPLRSSSFLSYAEVERLVGAIKKILIKAIEHGGSSIKDFISSIGSEGRFQDNFFVYGLEKNPCMNLCGGFIIRIRINNRSSFYCKNCQL